MTEVNINIRHSVSLLQLQFYPRSDDKQIVFRFKLQTVIAFQLKVCRIESKAIKGLILVLRQDFKICIKYGNKTLFTCPCVAF